MCEAFLVHCVERAADVSSGAPFSWNPLDDLQELLRFAFMRNAFLAGGAVAVVAGTVGFFVVLRRLSFAAHSLANTGFAGATGAMVVGVDPLIGLLTINAAGAACIGILARRDRGRDVVVGVVLTAALGLGLLFLAMSRAQSAIPVLVGDVLGISAHEVTVTEIAALVIVGLTAAIYRPLLFASLDEEVAEARGVPVALMSLAMLMILAATASIATPIVGVLLTFALLVAPAATAARLASRPGTVIGISIVLSVVDMWTGLAVSYWVNVPPSVVVATLAFLGYVVSRTSRLPTQGRRRPSGHVPAG